MPLLKINHDLTLKLINRSDFKNEKELHLLIEKNLLYLTGIKLIASEYPIPNGRIDSLGLDEDNVPVIIEYKWRKDLSAVIQGLFYLDWVMQNRKPFESIVKDKLGKDIEVNWGTQPRLLIIAQDFDIKELSAINQATPSVELKKYSLYEGLFNIEDVNILKTKTPPKPVNGDQVIEKYTLEHLLDKASNNVQEIFSQLRDNILGISDAVWEKVGSNYCDYRTTSTFASLHFRKAKLKIFIKMGEVKIHDPKKKCTPIPPSFGFGLLNTQFEIQNKEEIEYAMKLIMQAYDYVSD
jgi:predicted transport protein